METQLFIAIGTLVSAVVALFGLLMKAYKAIGEQKDLRFQDKVDHDKDLNEIKGLLQSRSLNGRRPPTERRGPDDTSQG